MQLAAFKRAEEDNGFVLRLHEATGRSRAAGIVLPALGIDSEIALGPFEVKTLFAADGAEGLEEVDLLERRLNDA